MFDQLPETIPYKAKKRKRALALSIGLHVALVALVIGIQMFGPGQLAGVELLTTLYMAPLPPPMAPPPPPPPGVEARESKPAAATEKPRVAETPRPVESTPVKPIEQPTLIQPMAIPKDLARIGETAPSEGRGGVIGGVPGGVIGGVPGGLPGGTIGGVLGGVANAPPPPPPPAPVRVGGSIKEPKITKMVQPVYPEIAVKNRIEGVVVLEATVTEKGTVDKLKVISGPPALVPAAIAAVQQWRYEPTRLNGVPVPVLLTARVSFSVKR
jgi:protein TonB